MDIRPSLSLTGPQARGLNSASGFSAGDLERTPATQPGLYSEAFLGIVILNVLHPSVV